MSRTRNLSRFAGATAGAMLVASLGNAAEAVVPPDPCPPVLPVASLTEGQELTGLTTHRGATPTEFTATVLGVLDDGIAPDVDMILVDAHSTAIDDAGGIWAGMSGSPLYTEDGQLVGAVSYGLSWGPSSIAGVTPAAEMRRLHGGGVGGIGGVAPATTVPLPSKLAATAVSKGLATKAEASGGLAPLATPMGVSGLSQRRIGQVAEDLERRYPGAKVYRMAAASALAAAGDPSPGAPLGAALTYGDVTVAATGTTTDVCGSSVVGFGHPLNFAGEVSYSAHPASAVVVQPDPAGTPFVVSNLGLPAWGTVDQDRLAGVRAIMGPVPSTTAVTSSLAGLDTGLSRNGRTDVVVPDYVVDAAAYHLMANLDRVLDKWGAGSTTFAWSVAGSYDGDAFSFSRDERLGSNGDVSVAAAIQVFELLQHLTAAGADDLTVDSVTFDGDGTGTFDGATLTGLQVRLPNGTWTDVSASEPVDAVAGARLHVRAVLTKRDRSTSLLPLTLAVQPAAAGQTGTLVVNAGTQSLACDPESGQTCVVPSFDEALEQVESAPTGDTVEAELTASEAEGPVVGAAGAAEPSAPLAEPVRATAEDVVSGAIAVPVNVVAARSARIGVVRGGSWSLRNSATAGRPSSTFAYGRASDRPVMGDWDGNGSATAGVFRNGQWLLRNSTVSMPRWGRAGDLPVVGDWDGDGDDDIGVYRAGTFLLRTDGPSGPGRITFAFGTATGQPVAGDWDGDGVDGVGTFQSGAWSLRNELSAGPADLEDQYGRAGDRPVTGDWDRDGATDLGVFRSGKWYLRSSAGGGTASSFAFGSASGTPVVWR